MIRTDQFSWPSVLSAMNIFEFYRDVLSSEEITVEFLRQYGLFDEASVQCPGRPSRNCGHPMQRGICKTKRGERTPVWKCTKKVCRSSKSIHCTNSFFTFRDRNNRNNNKLRLKDIVLLVHECFTTTNTIDNMMKTTRFARQTIVDWLSLFREVCSTAVNAQSKWGCTEEKPAQADEAYFAGRRKYGRGRYRNGDKRLTSETEARKGLSIDTAWSQSLLNGRLVGPWVVGVYASSKHVRFVVVDDRKSTTLIPIINSFIEQGSAVVTDECCGYNSLSAHVFVHHTVCHKRNFVNSENGFHTQSIERMWQEGKAHVKRGRGASSLLQSHLGEVSWRILRQNSVWPKRGLVHAFLDMQLLSTGHI